MKVLKHEPAKTRNVQPQRWCVLHCETLEVKSVWHKHISEPWKHFQFFSGPFTPCTRCTPDFFKHGHWKDTKHPRKLLTFFRSIRFGREPEQNVKKLSSCQLLVCEMMWPPFLRWCHFLVSFRWDNESIGKSTICQLHLKVFQWILWGSLPGGPRVLPSFWASEPQVIPSWSMVAYAGVTCRMQRDGWRMGFYGVLALGSWGWAICRNLRKWEGENTKMWGPNPVAVQWLEKWSLRALEVTPGSHLLWWSGFAVPLVKHGHGRVLLPVHVLSIKWWWMFDCCRFLPENMLLEVCVCVCVGRLKRRKTCFLSYHIAGGHWGSIQSVANEDTVYFLCKRTCFSFNCWPSVLLMGFAS